MNARYTAASRNMLMNIRIDSPVSRPYHLLCIADASHAPECEFHARVRASFTHIVSHFELVSLGDERATVNAECAIRWSIKQKQSERIVPAAAGCLGRVRRPK